MEQNKCEIPKIINLSNKVLSTQQIQILSKGLKYTPTPQHSNFNEVQDDISAFCRKLRLTEELFDKENNDESIVRNKSTYSSAKGRNKTLDKFCDYVTTFPYSEIPNTKFKSNTSRKEWEIIHELKNDNNIIIKEAEDRKSVV